MLVTCQSGTSPSPARPVVLSLSERLEAGGRSLEFRLATEKIYPCINFSFPAELTPVGAGWRLRLGAVVEDDFCFTATGPARALASPGAPRPGTYPVMVENLGVAATGTLRITAETIALELPGRAGVRVQPALLGRIPAGTIWGVVGYDTPQQEAGVRAFLAALENAGAQRLALPEADYGYFKTDASGQLLVPDPSGYWFARGFIYRYTGDAQLLRRLVRRAYLDNGGQVHPNVRTDRGEEFFGYLP